MFENIAIIGWKSTRTITVVYNATKKQFWIMLSPYEKGFRSGSAIRETERPFMTSSRINLTVVAQFMCLFWGGIYHESHSYSTLGFSSVLSCLFIYFVYHNNWSHEMYVRCRSYMLYLCFSNCNLLIFKVQITCITWFLGSFNLFSIYLKYVTTILKIPT